MRQLYCKYKLEGRRIFNEFLTIAQILNFLFFFCSVGFRYYAEALFPASIDVQGDEYLDALPCVNFKVWAVSVAGVNVFLNWFKFIQVCVSPSEHSAVQIDVMSDSLVTLPGALVLTCLRAN